MTRSALSARGGWQLAAAERRDGCTIELGRDESATRLARFVAAYGRTVGRAGARRHGSTTSTCAIATASRRACRDSARSRRRKAA